MLTQTDNGFLCQFFCTAFRFCYFCYFTFWLTVIGSDKVNEGSDSKPTLSVTYRVGHKKPSPILFCLKYYCICLCGQNDKPYKLLVCSADINIKI